MKIPVNTFLFFFVFLLIQLSAHNQIQAQPQPQPQLQSKTIKTQDLLNSFTNNIKSKSSVKMEFEMITSSGNYKGSVVASGSAYKMENNELELFCDGETKWIVNHPAKEISIFHHDPGHTDIVENPMGFFGSLDKGYTFSEKSSLDNKGLYIIELKPKNKHTAYKTITLGIEPGSYNPGLVRYTAKDNTVYTIIISKFTSSGQPSAPFSFRLSEPYPSGYFVNDLR